MALEASLVESQRMDTNKTRTRGRSRRSPEQGRRLVESWRASGLAAPEYCQRKGISLHALRYWASRSKSRGVSGSRPDFFVMTAGEYLATGDEAKPGAEEVSPDEGKAVVIVLPLQAGAAALSNTLKAVFAEVRR